MRIVLSLFIGLLVLSGLFTACTVDGESQISLLGQINFPSDNLNTPEKIALGKKLFFDSQLSSNGEVSCASCHLPELAFTDGKKKSAGVEGRESMRNAPSLLNSGYLKTTMYDAHIETLELQMLVPLQDHAEMNANIDSIIDVLKLNPSYEAAAQSIFQREFDPWVLTRSIAAYERSLISDNAKFDQWKRGEVTLSSSESRGWSLFSEELHCAECHVPPHFTNYLPEHNGLYADYGEDLGRYRIHNDSADIGFFKIPSLRNVELTAPYMHDGSMSSLRAVLEHYMSGGKEHVGKSDLIQPFTLSSDDKSDLIDFFKTLTDTSYLRE